MKKRLFTFLLLTVLSQTVFAHPSDSAPINLIDRGSTLTMLRDINIPANNVLHFQGLGARETFEYSSTRAYCSISAYDSNTKGFGRDVVIKAGMVVTLTSMRNGVYSTWITESGNYLIIKCKGYAKASRNYKRGTATIGELKHVLGDYMELMLADPYQFN